MKTEEQIKALAELDGWVECRDINHCLVGRPPVDQMHEDWKNQPITLRAEWNLKPYLTSYDAIISLVQKQKPLVLLETGVQLAIMRRKLFGYPTDNNVEGWIMTTLIATPAQLCEALLRATGKWIE